MVQWARVVAGRDTGEISSQGMQRKTVKKEKAFPQMGGGSTRARGDEAGVKTVVGSGLLAPAE